MKDKKYSIWLSGLPKIGSRRYMELINYFGSAKSVFECSREELIKSNIVNVETVDTIISKRDKNKIDRYMKKVKENDITVYTIDEIGYPENLKNIYDPPPVLYVKGKITEEDINSIAIVGSRKATEYGLKTAEQFGKEVAESGFTVVSGMALGIDSAAHRGAIKAGGRTIAVFACGLNYIYPRSGLSLAKEIIKNGAIISEYPLGIEAVPRNFPARNRIISGMVKGVLIVEANKKSGSLITADFALEQGRDVFAVPGNINSPSSKGTNELIKNGAKLVDSISDIMEEYYGYFDINNVCTREAILDETETEIINLLKISGKSLDDIIETISIEPSKILSAMTLLEIRGIIKQINGVFYYV